MITESKSTVAVVPTFGALSVAVPFIGVFLFLLLASLFSTVAFAFIVAILIIPLSPICGVVFAVVAWKRGERYWALRWIGLLINLAAIYFLIKNASHMFDGTSFG